MAEVSFDEETRAYSIGEQARTSIQDRRGNHLVTWLPILDAAFVGLSFALAYWLRFEVLPYQHTQSVVFYSLLIFFVIPIWLVLFTLWKLYDHRFLFGGTKEYAHIVNACTLGMVVIVFYSFLCLRGAGPEENISRIWLLLAWGLSILLVGGYRFTFRRWVYYLRKKGYLLSRAIIVGANEESRAIIEQLRTAPATGIKIVGIVDNYRPKGSRIGDLPVLGKSNALSHLVEQYQADELIISPTALSREDLLDIYRTFGGMNSEVEVRLSPGLFELFTTGVRVQQLGFVPLISLNKLRINGMEAFLKSLLDYTLIIATLILWLPLMLAIAVLVKLDSPGPVIYRRRVLGAGGQAFDAFKFRTMTVDAEDYLQKHPALAEELKRTGKIKNDPRVTHVGRFLRKYSLDELPQLSNVLLRQMSLVGPRMITPSELQKFGRWKYNLLTVKPGLTGLWQVSGRSDLSYEDRVRLDMYYIRNYTIWLDLHLLFNTIRVVLQGKGAY